MKVVEHRCVVVRMDECERILAAAKERGEKEIRYTAHTEGGEPVSVLGICGKADSSGFYLDLTAERPEAEKKGGYSADDVAEKLIDALGLATLAGADSEDAEIEDYCTREIAEIANWLDENGYRNAFDAIAAKATLHLYTAKKEEKP